MVLARSSVLEGEDTPISALPLRSAGIRWGNGVSTISAFTPSAFARSLQVSTSKPIGLLSASREPIGGKSRVTAQRSFPELIMSSSLSAFANPTAVTPRATTRHKVFNIPVSWFRDAIFWPAVPENASTPTRKTIARLYPVHNILFPVGLLTIPQRLVQRGPEACVLRQEGIAKQSMIVACRYERRDRTEEQGSVAAERGVYGGWRICFFR